MKTIPLLLACGLPLLPIMPVAAAAQAGAAGQAVVQPLPPPAAQELKEALGRLARDPRNVDALIAAGTASLEIGDVDAAVGFFGRAEQLAPDDPRIKAGRAAAYVRNKRPDEALRLFQEAEAAGVDIAGLAGDYGLAWDLVGNNREAQLRYRRALAARPADDEVVRRLALSLAIDGNEQGFEQTLRPLLERRDLAAYRTRAFGLAILGKPDDAVAISEAVMDRTMAGKLEPYLRFMPQLTNAQQAAAANLGIYPTAARIGRDDPRIAALSGSNGAARPARTVDTGLAPAGAPLGAVTSPAPARVSVPPAEVPPRQAATTSGSREGAERLASAARREAASDPLTRTSERPRIVARSSDEGASRAAVADPVPASAPPLAAAGQVKVPASPAPQMAAPSAPSVAAMRLPEAGSGNELAPVLPSAQAVAAKADRTVPDDPAPGFDLRVASATGPAPASGTGQTPARSEARVPAPTPAPVSAPASAPASVADAFADLQVPVARGASVPAAGAVNIAAIKAPREIERKEPPAKPEPPKPVVPSRFWVQVATGQDKGALKFDWRRLTKQADGLLDGKGPWVTSWGQTNRLLAGPYKTREEARSALKNIQEKGLDAFTFTSPEGQEVEQLR